MQCAVYERLKRIAGQTGTKLNFTPEVTLHNRYTCPSGLHICVSTSNAAVRMSENVFSGMNLLSEQSASYFIS